MANRYFQQFSMTPMHGVVKLYGKVTTTTGGTIGSSSLTYGSIAKTATETGRYTVTLEDSYVDFVNCSVIVQGSTDAAYTTTAGLIAYVRNVSVNDSTPTFQIQFADNALADAELADGAIFYFEVTLKNSTANP
jgi:hypothetical protein